jgi:hypothetical protein
MRPVCEKTERPVQPSLMQAGLPPSKKSSRGAAKKSITSVPSPNQASCSPRRQRRSAKLDPRSCRAQIGAMAQKTEQARRGLDAIAGMAREASCKGPPPRITMNYDHDRSEGD